ncbi:MAG: hypothetical protein AAFY11_13555 [Cyanobacteria bacterium J06641_5]
MTQARQVQASERFPLRSHLKIRLTVCDRIRAAMKSWGNGRVGITESPDDPVSKSSQPSIVRQVS